MPNPIIDVLENREWRNWHSSRRVGGLVARLYTPRNAWDDGSQTPGKPFAAGLAGLQQIVKQAEVDRRRVRAVGSGWSLSSAPFVSDYLVNTARLSSWFLGFRTPTLVDTRVRAASSRLVFAQCGIQIKALNTFLEGTGLALPTSGASNGQTIVGAMSTGTHGSAHDIGSIQDYILGLHVVAEGGKHYWIERPSQPTMTQAFADWLGAELRRDEDLFLSAVVGFGSFGLVHAVMFQAVPLYLLELWIKQCDYDDVEAIACSRDFSQFALKYPAETPYHFEVVINPYKRKRGEQGAFMRVMYKRPVTGSVPSPPPTDGANILSRDLVSIAGHFSDAIPGLVPGILQSQLLSALPPTDPGTVLATPGIHFGDSQPTNGGTSIELGVPLNRVADALDAIFSVTDQQTFGAPVALRYVKASDAVLAFTCHAPTTCTIEMPGIDSDSAEAAHARIFEALAQRRVPVTYHWGQQGKYDPASIVAGYSDARVGRWLGARRRFLSPEGRRMFSNDLLDGCGLSQ